jgi:hypothetical protein
MLALTISGRAKSVCDERHKLAFSRAESWKVWRCAGRVLGWKLSSLWHRPLRWQTQWREVRCTIAGLHRKAMNVVSSHAAPKAEFYR